MTGLNAGHVGMAGEVRCVIKREDGSIKEDTGFQKNMILNQGLDFFGGAKGFGIFYRCVIGSGNSNPLITQTQLDSFLAITNGVKHSSKYDYVPDSSNLYKTNEVFKYTFTGLSDTNVSEVGLVSQGTTSADYYLCTRALLKDTSGAPTTITILSGEVLEVYYKVWRVVSTLDATYVVNMLDGKGGATPYNISTRLANAGVMNRNSVGETVLSGITLVGTYSGGLGSVTSTPTGHLTDLSNRLSTWGVYLSGSYKRVLTVSIPVSLGNNGIRAIMPFSYFCPTQIRFGSVTNDSIIPKTSLQTLSIPLEFSWGRYEGEL